MPISQYYVDPVAGADVPGGGAIGAPWLTLQYALNTIVRNAVDGDQINLKSSGAHVNAASLSLAAYGAPSIAAPLLVRGYTVAANDGGIGEIDCGGNTLWVAVYDNLCLIDLEIHTPGAANHMILLGNRCHVFRCELHRGASAVTDRTLLLNSASGGNLWVEGCYFHDMGTGNCRGIYSSMGSARLFGNYVVMDPNSTLIGIDLDAGGGSIVEGNIVVIRRTNQRGIRAFGDEYVLNNIVYSTVANTRYGIDIDVIGCQLVRGNVVCGISGVGGVGIRLAGNAYYRGYNAFYNCTANYTVGDQIFIDESANDVILAADPFTNAAAGDFSLTAAGRAALRDLGWPAAYLGAHANTDGHITIGPIQYGPSPDFPAVGDVEAGVAYDGGGMVGTFAVPAVGDVRNGVGYGAGGVEFVGTLVAGGGLLAASKRGGKQ